MRVSSKFPKVAFYGNNLNVGYRFVRYLNREGWDAHLYCIHYPSQQEQHEWWSNEPLQQELITYVPDFTLGRARRLTRTLEIRALYDKLRRFDVLIMAETGPALFSELLDVPKIFFAFGADLQLLPFLLSRKAGIAGRIRRSLRGPRAAWLEFWELVGYAHLQRRQRAGIRQARKLILSTHQLPLVERLRIPRERVELALNIPMDPNLLLDVPKAELQQLRVRYGAFDKVFLHPTRHMYLRLDGDVYLKDNDKLLRAFARFVRRSRFRVRLLLIRKGRMEDIAESERLAAELGLLDHIDWYPEMSNRTLRAFYSLDNVVVCDQFNPNIAMLGNIGREASFYGRPLITAFGNHNLAAYAHDWPPHVFAADTEDAIEAALHTVTALDTAAQAALAQRAREWFDRNLSEQSLMPKYMQLIEKVVAESST